MAKRSGDEAEPGRQERGAGEERQPHGAEYVGQRRITRHRVERREDVLLVVETGARALVQVERLAGADCGQRQGDAEQRGDGKGAERMPHGHAVYHERYRFT
jgi:hypothetical protein